jgi:hypothetical protein
MRVAAVTQALAAVAAVAAAATAAAAAGDLPVNERLPWHWYCMYCLAGAVRASRACSIRKPMPIRVDTPLLASWVVRGTSLL